VTVGSWRVRARVAAAVVVAVTGVAGCSAQSGAAAVVEGRTIPVADVDAATEELAPYLQNASPSSVLLLLVAEPVFERVATANGIGVSDQEAQDVLDALAAPPEPPAGGADGADDEGQAADGATEPPEFGPASLSVARLTLLQRKLGEHPDGQALMAEVTADLAELDVDVNPRYGQIDLQQGGITPVEHDWLVPAPEPAADPAPGVPAP
jgi:hypothetical protein